MLMDTQRKKMQQTSDICHCQRRHRYNGGRQHDTLHGLAGLRDRVEQTDRALERVTTLTAVDAHRWAEDDWQILAV